MTGGYLVDNENDSVERAFSVPSPALQDFHVHNSAMDRKDRHAVGRTSVNPPYRFVPQYSGRGVPAASQLRTLLTDLASRNGHLCLPESPPPHHESGLSGSRSTAQRHYNLRKNVIEEAADCNFPYTQLGTQPKRIHPVAYRRNYRVIALWSRAMKLFTVIEHFDGSFWRGDEGRIGTTVFASCRYTGWNNPSIPIRSSGPSNTLANAPTPWVEPALRWCTKREDRKTGVNRCVLLGLAMELRLDHPFRLGFSLHPPFLPDSVQNRVVGALTTLLPIPASKATVSRREDGLLSPSLPPCGKRVLPTEDSTTCYAVQFCQRRLSRSLGVVGKGKKRRLSNRLANTFKTPEDKTRQPTNT
ncbi:hypothetical protein M407DRAFT_18176 [Tulasnella calospora MUT 4182]|uniref:Uncharacterized protein n=1 Tax=Tulasnella calospora MUT 4182 TaxID=1051891 RepID=A0A0C3QKH4_9AGAM|nr:hypothetical protein M407DRAFT_18176 [Tulasnella calospora MUT 4182]